MKYFISVLSLLLVSCSLIAESKENQSDKDYALIEGVPVAAAYQHNVEIGTEVIAANVYKVQLLPKQLIHGNRRLLEDEAYLLIASSQGVVLTGDAIYMYVSKEANELPVVNHWGFFEDTICIPSEFVTKEFTEGKKLFYEKNGNYCLNHISRSEQHIPYEHDRSETVFEDTVALAKPVMKKVNLGKKSLWVSKNEITFDQFDAYVKATGSFYPDDHGWGRGNRPVINVSWKDVNNYISWLNKVTDKNYRLPTKSEWLSIVSISNSNNFQWGNEYGQGKANCADCGSIWDAVSTSPVGSFQSNISEIYDLHGNVNEWLIDCDNEVDIKTCDYRLIIGGSWLEVEDDLSINSPNLIQSRHFNSSSNNLGFRIVRTAE